jgi:hypothetical protein
MRIGRSSAEKTLDARPFLVRQLNRRLTDEAVVFFLKLPFLTQGFLPPFLG